MKARVPIASAGVFFILILGATASLVAQPPVQFAVIGDYGWSGQAESDVSALVKSWQPDFIITTGDNNYEDGAASTIDRNIGQYYHEYISPYEGSYGNGAHTNRFYPCLGNHDWNTAGAVPYLNYFTLPGNERYYDFVMGPVHFYAIDSDIHEPDGISSTSRQALWLQSKLLSSREPWRIVFSHHPPYSSGITHGGSSVMRWPFKEWGASAVLSGHEHLYERLIEDGLPYFVNGLGGRSLYALGPPYTGSQVEFNGDYGAMFVQAHKHKITFQFFTRTGKLIDSYTMREKGRIVNVLERGGVRNPDIRLAYNYPNPFNPVTEFKFRITETGLVTLKIFNVLGVEVANLVDESKSPGEYSVSWDATNMPSGVYIYRLLAGSTAETGRMMLVK